MAESTFEPPTILIVDDDQVTLRYLDVSLSRSGRYNVEVADTVASAIEILSHEIIDVIVSDIDMPGSDGFWFLRHVKGRPRWSNIPMLFLTSDGKRNTRITALSRGICHYITKPSTVPEIIAHIEAVLRRESAVRSRLAHKNYSLAGDFATVPFTDLIGLLTMGQCTGRLAVLSPRAGGQLFFIKGMIHHATFANIEGEDAVYAIMAQQQQGQFEFQPDDLDPAEVPNTIAVSPTAMLMEGARRVDMTARHDDSPTSLSVPRTDKTNRRADETPSRMQGPARSAGSKDVYCSGVSDPFSLGELLLLRNRDIQEWTTAPPKGVRLQILLITDISAGVYALASLGSPLSEQQLDVALTNTRKSLQLTFEFRGNHSLDVLLVDQDRPGLVQGFLRQRPSILILAPRSGDWLTLSVKSQVDLATFIEELDPELILGVGKASVHEGLQEIVAKCSSPANLRIDNGVIDGPDADFRAQLLAGISAWADGPSSRTVEPAPISEA